MTGYELVKRAIEFDGPERLPFFQHVYTAAPDDVCDSWELDRQKAGWFFDNAAPDDWGCAWKTSEIRNMGRVVAGPLHEWRKLDTYRPPNPNDPFYYLRAEEEIAGAAERYVCLTSHFNLFERLHMLHGFEQTLVDFFLDPVRIERVLDMILDFKIAQLDEIHRRFGSRVHGVFYTDDLGTQNATIFSPDIFDAFFRDRYRTLIGRCHEMGFHFILHSCGKINELVGSLIDVGVDVLNMQQPRAYGIESIGARFGGKVAFLTTVDIQSTLPAGDAEAIRREAHLLADTWGSREGGLIVFNYGNEDAIAVSEHTAKVMFEAFMEKMWLQ